MKRICRQPAWLHITLALLLLQHAEQEVEDNMIHTLCDDFIDGVDNKVSVKMLETCVPHVRMIKEFFGLKSHAVSTGHCRSGCEQPQGSARSTLSIHC